MSPVREVELPDWVIKWLSAPRLAPYVRAVGRSQAVELYRWNCRLSVSAFELIGWFEVAWRNALDSAIVARRRGARPHWLLDRSFPLQGRTWGKVDAAIESIWQHNGIRNPTPDQIIAELTLGFWRFTTRRYENALWDPYLNRMFPHAARRPLRGEVDDTLNQIIQLRNRIAHHEPIFGHPEQLRRRVDDMCRLGGWLNPQAADWWRRHASIIPLLDRWPGHLS